MYSPTNPLNRIFDAVMDKVSFTKISTLNEARDSHGKWVKIGASVEKRYEDHGNFQIVMHPVKSGYRILTHKDKAGKITHLGTHYTVKLAKAKADVFHVAKQNQYESDQKIAAIAAADGISITDESQWPVDSAQSGTVDQINKAKSDIHDEPNLEDFVVDPEPMDDTADNDESDEQEAPQQYTAGQNEEPEVIDLSSPGHFVIINGHVIYLDGSMQELVEKVKSVVPLSPLADAVLGVKIEEGKFADNAKLAETFVIAAALAKANGQSEISNDNLQQASSISISELVDHAKSGEDGSDLSQSIIDNIDSVNLPEPLNDVDITGSQNGHFITINGHVINLDGDMPELVEKIKSEVKLMSTAIDVVDEYANNGKSPEELGDLLTVASAISKTKDHSHVGAIYGSDIGDALEDYGGSQTNLIEKANAGDEKAQSIVSNLESSNLPASSPAIETPTPKEQFVTLNGKKVVLDENTPVTSSTIAAQLHKLLPYGVTGTGSNEIKKLVSQGKITNLAQLAETLAVAGAYHKTASANSGIKNISGKDITSSYVHFKGSISKLKEEEKTHAYGSSYHSKHFFTQVLDNLTDHEISGSPTVAPYTPTPATPPVVDTSAANIMSDLNPSQGDFVTIGGQVVNIGESSSDKSKIQLAASGHSLNYLNTTGTTALSNAINNGTISSTSSLAQTVAIAKASSTQAGHNKVGQYSVNQAINDYGSSIEKLKNAADAGDMVAKGIVSHIGETSFKSAAEQAVDAANNLGLSDIMYQKTGSAAGSNEGGFYTASNGDKYYVKKYVTPEQAYTEHVANSIYSALGHSAPASRIFDDGNGNTFYASKIIDSNGTLGSNTLTKPIADNLLKGFAADVLLGNWDVLGQSNDNVLVHGPDVHRIDNGGSLTYRAKGGKKSQEDLNAIHEWDSLSSSKNANYKNVFKKAGIDDPTQIPGITSQIQNIEQLKSKYGSWDNFLKKTSPNLPEKFRTETAALLEKRSSLLTEKKDAIIGYKSLVNKRIFKLLGVESGASSKAKAESYKQLLKVMKKNVSPHITPSQEQAIVFFKHSSEGINTYLAQKLKGKPTTYANSTADHLVTMFSNPEIKLGEDSVLHRFCNIPEEDLGKMKVPGSHVFFPVVQATNIHGEWSWHNNCQLRIFAPKETAAVAPSLYSGSLHKGEHEVMIGPVTYRVLKYEAPNGYGSKVEDTPEGKWKWDLSKHRFTVEIVIPGVND